jgi:hypothetical protein
MSVLVTVLCALACPPPLRASGPFFTPTVTFVTENPAFPQAFATGDLGIVKPTFSGRYLVAAFRVLSGRPPSPVGLRPQNERPGFVPHDPAEREFWEAVARVSATPRLQVSDWRSLQNYTFFINCTDATWENAVATLNARIARYGGASREVAEWLTGQLDVLRNCGDAKSVTIPAAVPAWADATLRADREYQIAAAYFYAMQYEESARRFMAIAADASSAWQPYGRYLAARSMIRQATLVANAPQAALFVRAREELERVRSDADAAPLHPSAAGLLEFIAAREHPTERMHDIATRLIGAAPPSDQDFDDYLYFLRRTDLKPGSSADEVTDWITTLRGAGNAASEHALQQWRQRRSDTWLMAALWTASPDSTPADLDAAAAAVPKTSAAFPTVTALRLRSLLQQGRNADASGLLATLPTRYTGNDDVELTNIARAARMRMARTLTVFVDNLTRQGVVPGKTVETIDDDAAVAFNRYLPLNRWADVVESSRVPRRIRIRLAQVAFTRATVLNRHDVARRVAPTLAELAPTLRADLDAYMKAGDAAAQHRAAVLLLLRTPGMTLATWGMERDYPLTPDEPHRMYRTFENYWWCSADVPPSSQLTQFLFGNKFEAPQFLTAAERATAAGDLNRLNDNANPEMYLTREAIAWARSSPDDPLVPEILSRAVRGWRFVHCVNQRDATLAKQAFRLLHTRYAKNEWAERTPYWYD